MAESINEFLKRRNEEARKEGEAFDWGAQKSAWLRDLEALYGRILDWLKPSLDESIVTASYDKAILEEEDVGRYDTRSLVLHFGKDRVRFRPVGMRVFGAKGRVDILSGERTVMLLRGEGSWSFSQRERDGSRKSWSLTEESFGDLLRQMLS